MPTNPNILSKFWQELKRRRVIHVITVYASASFVLIELVNNLTEPLNLPPRLSTIVVVILAVGFPLAVILAWIYDLTPGGIEKTKAENEAEGSKKTKVPNAWRIATYVSFVVIAGLLTLVFYRGFIFDGATMLYGDDMINEGYQLRSFGVGEIRSGRGFPLWNPFVYGGQPYLAILPGPVFYRQERCGEHSKKFILFKLRTMPVDAEAESGPVMTAEDDPRRTRSGAFLRRWNLDELPQLWNVLIGDMALVGPRPERPHFVEQFKEEIGRYMSRHVSKPGITGWAQVNGLRGNTSIEERIKYDLYYLENWSLAFDFKILLQTILSRENAY